jgi:hypothetical protein
MTSGYTIDILVTFSEIFEEEPKDLQEYLTGISRSKLLNASAFFLGFNNEKSKYKEYLDFLNMFFRKENSEIAGEIYTKLNNLKDRAQAELILVTPLSILQLFEFSFDHLTDKETQTDIETEINIFKSILYLNEQNIKAQNIASTSIQDVHSDLKIAALSLSQSFPYSELINYDISEVLAAQMIKSIFLFEFLESNSSTKVLLSEFLKYFECPDWKYFLKSTLPLSFAVMNPTHEAHTDIVVKPGADFENGCRFIEKLIVTDTDLLEGYDFIKTRSKPFYKVDDGVYRIINGLFVIELIHKGVYFKLTEINKTLNKNDTIKNFRSFYCDEFSEKYLLYKLLNSIYQNRYIEYSGADILELGINSEPDYYIRNGNHLFLFESKDIFINASIKTTYDYTLYEPEFRKKLYFDIKNDKQEKKAVLQLINNIENSLTKNLLFDTNYKTSSLHIYPILILHDRQFNLIGLNYIINAWFKDELGKLKEKGINIDKVKPLTIIDIDTIIFHQDLFRDRTLKMNLILDEYFKYITFDSKRKYVSEEHLKNHVMRTLQNFSLFLANYVSDNKIRRVPKMIMEKGITILN